MTALQIIWFVLIFVIIIGYFILDGFDLGIGVFYPFLGKNERDKAVMRRAIGPVWDGNEVWLLTAGGALFAAFPPAYATTFSGFYLAIMLVLFGLIIRAISVEYRGRDPKHAKAWDMGFFIGSLLPALLLGVAIGNVLGGIGLNEHGDYVDGFFRLLDPFSLSCGLVGLATFMALGAGWVAVKTEDTDALHTRAVDYRRIMLAAVAVLFVLATILYFAATTHVLEAGIPAVLRIVFVVVIVAALVATFMFAARGRSLAAFISSALICVGLVGLTGASLFPRIVPATNDALSLTVANSASSDTALLAMLIITCIGLPLVLIYHVFVYRTFRGTIKEEDLEEY